MRREITAHTRDPDDTTEVRQIKLAADCGVTVHEVSQKEEQHVYIPHRIVVYSKADALRAFTQALMYSDLRVGQISVWDG